MKSLKILVVTLGVFAACASAQAATINCTAAVQQAHIAALEQNVQTLITQVRALENQMATSPRQSIDTTTDTRVPLGTQFDIATGG